ncbi:MAG: hypothetical protein PWP71_109 [Clostridia bacterium]|jgi:hybrid cluster-associated redox disulfide protein|nr:hypothetical protein [Clostridia bacterium]
MISKDISIMELLQTHPGAAEILKSMGMGCCLCMGASTETLEQGIRAHGLNLEEVLNRLNEVMDKDK